MYLPTTLNLSNFFRKVVIDNEEPKLVHVLNSLAVLIMAKSDDHNTIVAAKKDIAKLLDTDELREDIGLAETIRHLANVAAASTPPSREDIKNAGSIGEIVVPKSNQTQTDQAEQ